jgi:hypothetical protein
LPSFNQYFFLGFFLLLLRFGVAWFPIFFVVETKKNGLIGFSIYLWYGIVNYRRTQECSIQGQSICFALSFSLFLRTLYPYLSMIDRFIFDGVLSDPFRELFVRAPDNPNSSDELQESGMRRVQDWSQCILCEDSRIPLFLRPVSDQVGQRLFFVCKNKSKNKQTNKQTKTFSIA